MALPLLLASFVIPYIPTIINALAGSDTPEEARAKLAPQHSSMIEQFIGRGMNRQEATEAADEAIQAAVKEGTEKKLLPPWVDDAATMAGIVTGGAALGGGKLLAAGAKMAGAKMGQAAAKTGAMASKMEKTAGRINDATKRAADPARAAALKAGPKPSATTPPVDRPVRDAPGEGAERFGFDKKNYEADKFTRDSNMRKETPTTPLRNDDPEAYAADAVARERSTISPFKPNELIPGDRAPRGRNMASRNDAPINQGSGQPRIAADGLPPMKNAEFELVDDMPINLGGGQPRLAMGDMRKPFAPARPRYQEIADDEMLSNITEKELRDIMALG